MRSAIGNRMTPRRLQRKFAQVHHAQKSFADEHERQQQHERDADFAQDHPCASLGATWRNALAKMGMLPTGSVIRTSRMVAEKV